MSVPTQGWTREKFLYTDDFGVHFAVRLNDYIGDAGGLERYDREKHTNICSGLEPHLRHLRVRSLEPDQDGKKDYKDIPVQETNPLWTGPVGQRLTVAGREMEVMRKVEEIEYGRKGRAAQRSELRKQKKLAAPNAVRCAMMAGNILNRTSLLFTDLLPH